MSVSQLDVALDRPLPQAPEAERAVLGTILTSFSHFWRVVTIIGWRDFFRDEHRAIWRCIEGMSEEHGAEIDLLTVKHALANLKKLDEAGGSAYISSLVDGVPDVGNVERYARIVKEKADLRRIIVSGNKAMRRALNAATDTAATIASEVAAELQGLSVREDRQSRSLAEVQREVDAKQKKRAEAGKARGIPFGSPLLDASQVIRRGALTVFAAPTMHGKSIFMLNAAVGAVKQGARVAFYSIEMLDEDVLPVTYSILSKVPLDVIKAGRIQDETWRHRVTQARAWINEQGERYAFADKIRDIDSLYADCRRRKREGVDIVFLDYLQLVRRRQPDREQAVDEVTQALHYLSQDLDIAVVTGSQVNKDYQKRDNGRLSIRDLQYGEVIGKHARVVCMWQCPRQDDKAADGEMGPDGKRNPYIPWCRMIFQLEKNSGGKTGDIPMHAKFDIQTIAEGTCADNRPCKDAPQAPATDGGLFGR